MTNHQGQNIQLFLAEGSSTGLRIAEIKFRSERVTAAVRSDLVKQRELEEVQRTGLYLLTGASPVPEAEGGIYIGESDDVASRLKTHSDKAASDLEYLPWWEHTITITSNDANLTKAHALYLESRMIRRAKDANRAHVANSQAPDRRHTLSRADRSDMEVFLANVFVILPLLGVDAFRPRPQVSAVPSTAPLNPDESPVFSISHSGTPIARGQEIDGQFVVAQDSKARIWHGAVTAYQGLQEQLTKSGVLTPHDATYLLFTQDTEFKSPSAAAAVVSGRNANGRTEWARTDRPGTYASWQDEVTGAGS